jgi:hypothetical protein
MKNINLFLLLIITAYSFAEEGRLGREDNEYRYTSLGIDLIQTDKTGVGAKLSLALPGPLYVVVERKAEGVDTEDNSYDRISNGLRLGAHIGIGDLLSEETDQKYGASFLYNISKRTAFSIEVSSSKVFDSTFKVGYQVNF